MNKNIERLSELVRKPQLTMIGAPPTINALAFARQLFDHEVLVVQDERFSTCIDHFPLYKQQEQLVLELQSIFPEDMTVCMNGRDYDFILTRFKVNFVKQQGIPVVAVADFTKNAYNAPAELSSFTGNARLVYTADAVLAMQRFQNAIRVSCLKAPWNDYAAWKEPLVDFFVEYDPESQTFHEVPAPEITPLEDLSRINTRKRSARK